MTSPVPSVAPAAPRTRLGSVLMEMGLISQDELADLLTHQRTQGGKLGELLVAQKRLSPEQVAKALARRLGLEYAELAVAPDPAIAAVIDDATARRYLALPIRRDPDGVVVVAMADPQDLPALDSLRMIIGERVRPVLAMPEAIMAHVGVGTVVGQLAAHLSEVTDWVGEAPTSGDLVVGENDGPVIRFVNSIIARAVAERASDVHIEPQDGDLVVRFRVDGILRTATSVPASRGPAIVSRLKVMSELDIAERRVPQDGRVGIRMGDRDLDLRIATLPTVGGESVVVRLLDRSNATLDLAELGFSPRMLQRWERCYRQPHGLVLVTGATGSGKTSTLYATLSRLNDNERKIITVEDPVEYRLVGVNQVQIRPKAGLTFASGLRSMLRCDPDVLMVGEIRDAETARIAVEAALTGHMVVATIHTNDAAGAIVRLTEMGIEPFLLASALRGVLAQRLARRLCLECREATPVPHAALADLVTFDDLPSDLPDPAPIHRARGCARCSGTGYYGRFALAETLVMNDAIERLTINRASASDIHNNARGDGMRTMAEEGLAAVLAGHTSLEELGRISR
jgi:type IV pilus assembly protein PilB